MIDSSMAGPPRPSWPTRLHRLLALLVGGVLAVAAGAAAPVPDTSKRIMVLPPLRWDATGVAWTYATEQGQIELARTMAGLAFGMTPEEASGRLLGARNALHWSDLPQATEFTPDVRYLWIPMPKAGALRAPVTSCVGDGSYIVLLFLNNALFRASWRFLPNGACPDVHPASEELYAAYVPLASNVAVSFHYQTGNAEVVDVTDPAAGPLIATRWVMRGQ